MFWVFLYLPHVYLHHLPWVFALQVHSAPMHVIPVLRQLWTMRCRSTEVRSLHGYTAQSALLVYLLIAWVHSSVSSPCLPCSPKLCYHLNFMQCWYGGHSERELACWLSCLICGHNYVFPLSRKLVRCPPAHLPSPSPLPPPFLCSLVGYRHLSRCVHVHVH